MRVAYASLLCCGLIFLTGCQSSSTFTKVVDTYKVLQISQQNAPIYISCAASIACNFSRVNDVVVMDEKQRPTRKALELGLLRLEGSVFALQNQYALSLWQGQHEIEVQFYPVSAERKETFHLIHNFKAGSQYKLVMYRQKNASRGSLLQVAAPGALCVDLLQGDEIQRRFCRTFDAVTGLGEFVEKKV